MTLGRGVFESNSLFLCLAGFFVVFACGCEYVDREMVIGVWVQRVFGSLASDC